MPDYIGQVSMNIVPEVGDSHEISFSYLFFIFGLHIVYILLRKSEILTTTFTLFVGDNYHHNMDLLLNIIVICILPPNYLDT